MICNIAKSTKKNPNFWHFRANIPNSRGMGHCPKMVKKSPELNMYMFTLNITELQCSVLLQINECICI